MAKSRKVLFIVIDQLRADCLTGDLGKHVNTPHLDTLRQEAVTFANHFTVCAPCGPARASLLTGQYPMNHRSVRNGTPLAGDTPNIATEARKAGYEPLLFGYTDTSNDPRQHHPNDPHIRSYEQVMPGFVEKLEMRQDGGSYPWRADLRAKGYDLPLGDDFYTPVSEVPGQPPKLNDPAFYAAKDSDTAFLTDSFLKEMAVRTDENWFTHLTFIRPHPPLVAPVPYNHMYNAADLPLPPRLTNLQAEASVHPFMTGALKRSNIENNTKGFSGRLDSGNDGDIQALRAIYLGLITEVDHHIGRVIAFLKSTGQYEDTLLVVTADHGEMLGDHYLWGKQHIYDGAYHIPLIIRDPDHKAEQGRLVPEFTESIDITPTILHWIGQDIPASMDGRPLSAFLRGTSPPDWRDYVYIELDYGDPENPVIEESGYKLGLHDSNLAILRERQFKLVHFNGGLPPLLYDLQSDPQEMVNLAGDPDHSATLLRLTRKMLDHRMRHANHSLSDMKLRPEGTLNF